MKPNDRMKEWRQTIVVICTVVLAFAAQSAYMQSENAAIRADMNAQFAAMHAEHAAMRADMNAQHAAIRADMNAQFATMHAQHAAIREQLSSMDRRTARIEGHLFGTEIPPDRADSE